VVSIADSRLARAALYARGHGVTVGRELAVNFLLPFLIYRYANESVGAVLGLIAASAPPILWAIVVFVRERRVDAISIMALSGIALSLLAFSGGGGIKMLQLRENLVTGLVGLVFLGSAAIGRPLISAGGGRRTAPGARKSPGGRDTAWGCPVPSLNDGCDAGGEIWAPCRVRAQLHAGPHGLDPTLPLDARPHQLRDNRADDGLDFLVRASRNASRRRPPAPRGRRQGLRLSARVCGSPTWRRRSFFIAACGLRP
jgi:hypothetical protein